MRLRIIIVLALARLMVAADVSPIEITHPPKYKRLADYTREAIAQTLKNVPEVWQSQEDAIRFRIVARADDFRVAVGADLPDWVGAVTLFPQDLVVVRSPDLSRSTLREYRSTVVHELIHLLQGQYVPLNLTPVWFNEGVAVYYAGEFGLRNRIVVSKALFRKKLIPLEKIERVLKFSHLQADLAYAESAALIEFIEMVYGVGTVVEILKTMRSGVEFERAVMQATDTGYENLLNQWEKYLARKYQWIFLLDIQNILWLIMPVAALLAYLSIRRRNKVTLKQWNDEETYENSDESNI
ncbi:MAG: peptidase MA family metallohydrolase [Candidatus Neomarinimicrobiota bacterium]|jgi:hypothetical protein